MKIINILLAATNGFVYHDNSPVQMDAPKLQRESMSDEKLKKIFDERKQRLQSFCKNRYPDATKKSWTDRPKHIYVADVDLGLLGCAPLKAGSSTWKAWWWYHMTPDMDHEGRSVPGHQGTISKIPVEHGEDLLNHPDKIRFLVVRHPLLRFYSGWHQKFAKSDPTSAQMLKRSAQLRELAEKNMKNETEPMTVDFDDFAHLYGTTPYVSVNSHFDSITNHCDICSFNYDYILKIETMNDEANYILRKTGMDIKPSDGFMHRNSQLTTDERIPSTVMQHTLLHMNLTDIQNLQKRFESDYDAFGYGISYDDMTLSGW